jgi:hypothetical protein
MRGFGGKPTEFDLRKEIFSLPTKYTVIVPREAGSLPLELPEYLRQNWKHTTLCLY